MAPLVNNVRNKGAELITPATPDELVAAEAATLDGMAPDAG